MTLDEVIEHIKQHPISDVISFYIPVNKRGANHEALCPFHGDSNPSLKISNPKKLYKCFACEASGDHFTFVQNYKHMNFIEAVKDIAGHLNLPVDELDKKKKKDPKTEMGLRVLTAANKLYRKYAAANHIDKFQKFLTDRGLDQRISDDFSIGFAPKGNVLLSYLNSIPEPDKTEALKIASEIGIIKSGQNGPYDAFRERVTFPIKDQFGQVRGFSCRATYEGQIPKYLNSHESFIFHKRNILFGLDIAKQYIRQHDAVIIVEGNMDAIALHQHGFNYSVATMGVALSDYGIQKLKSLTKNFYIAMDNDDAGMKASSRINADLLKQEILAKFIDLSPSKDPDDFLQEHGRLALQERIDNAPTFLDFTINQILEGKVPENPDLKHSILVEKVFPIIAPLKESLGATERVLLAAKKLGFQSDSSIILDTYRNFLKGVQETKKPSSYKAEEEVNYKTPKEPIQITRDLKLTKAEKMLVRELLSQPSLLENISQSEILDLLSHNEVKRLVQWLSNIYLEVEETEFQNIVRDSMACSDFNVEIKELISSTLFNASHMQLSEEVAVKLLNDIKNKLIVEQLKSERDELFKKQKVSAQQDEITNIIARISDIDKKLFELKNK